MLKEKRYQMKQMVKSPERERKNKIMRFYI